MKKRLLLLPIVAILAIGVYFYLNHSGEKPNVVPTEPKSYLYDPITIDQLFILTNSERIKAGVQPLQLREELNRSADRKVKEILAEAKIDPSNRNPHINLAGKHGYEYIYEEMPECIYGGENILMGIFDVEYGIQKWMGSDDHRSALLDPKYAYTGFGLDNNGMIIQHFCQVK